MIGLAGVLLDAGEMPAAGPAARGPLAPRPPHFSPQAKQVVHLFMNGGPSHVDTFDPKPKLAEVHGQPLPTQNLRTERKTGAAMKSPFKFARYGQSGLEVSELFAKTAEHADELCVIRSMYADVPNHEPSLMLMNCGEARLPRPSFGAWLTYGLGSENQNLPGFIVMCPGGYPIVSTKNWQSAFLPGAFQGTYLDTKHTEVDKLIANIRNTQMSLEEQRQQLDFVQQLNRWHRQPRAEPQLEARIESLELAFRMQTEAAEAFDIRRVKQRGLLETTLVLWGGEFGRTPVAELPALNGRDHNHYGFTCWLAGGGVKGGSIYGATDEFGLGFDHTRLTYRYAGRDFRFTDVHGQVIQELIA
jgi:hypothetical protein